MFLCWSALLLAAPRLNSEMNAGISVLSRWHELPTDASWNGHVEKISGTCYRSVWNANLCIGTVFVLQNMTFHKDTKSTDKEADRERPMLSAEMYSHCICGFRNDYIFWRWILNLAVCEIILVAAKSFSQSKWSYSPNVRIKCVLDFIWGPAGVGGFR